MHNNYDCITVNDDKIYFVFLHLWWVKRRGWGNFTEKEMKGWNYWMLYKTLKNVHTKTLLNTNTWYQLIVSSLQLCSGRQNTSLYHKTWSPRTRVSIYDILTQILSVKNMQVMVLLPGRREVQQWRPPRHQSFLKRQIRPTKNVRLLRGLNCLQKLSGWNWKKFN